MTNRNIFTALLLIASFMISSVALANARTPMNENSSPESMSFDRKRRGVPAPTPSPINKRPKPIQSPKPKN